MNMEFVRCNLCGSDRYTIHLVRGDLNLFIEGEFHLVRCTDCGLVYLNPRPSLDEIASLYLDDYDQFNIAVQDEPSCLARLDRRYGLRKRCRAILRYKRRGRLLDVGCATGDFLDMMREYPGWEVYGVELSKSASEYARNRLGLAVKTGILEDVDFPERYFDVVTLWNVLEHLPDPLGACQKIHSLLRPEGLLIFDTPNLDSLDARLFGPYWIGYELPRHLYVFSYRTLRALSEKAGFRIVNMRCLYGSHAAAASSIRFWLRARKRDARWLESVELVLFGRMLRLLALPYFFWMDRLRLSNALTVTCVKVE